MPKSIYYKAKKKQAEEEEVELVGLLKADNDDEEETNPSAADHEVMTASSTSSYSKLQRLLPVVGIVLIVLVALLVGNSYVEEQDLPVQQLKQQPNNLKFFLVAPPEFTSQIMDNPNATDYYPKNLNEESAEIWLQRGFASGIMAQQRTTDPEVADVIVVAGCLHLNSHSHKRVNRVPEILQVYERDVIHHDGPSTIHKPHLMLIPSTNPGVAEGIGLLALVKMLLEKGISKQNLWTVGFERNPNWQGIEVDRIVPIPYVVRAHDPLEELLERSNHAKVPNSVFYAGDPRHNAEGWAHCFRTKMITPLHEAAQAQNLSNIDVRLVVTQEDRLSQEEYNHRMLISEYCLILCGDTPSSRSMTSAMVAGCIPIQVGSRLQGICDPPCEKGWGWTISGKDYPHLPYSDLIPWDEFPVIGEQQLMDHGLSVLEESVFQVFSKEQKHRIHSIMQGTLSAWIYGWGDPATSTDFGDAIEYIWNSFGAALNETQQPNDDNGP